MITWYKLFLYFLGAFLTAIILIPLIVWDGRRLKTKRKRMMENRELYPKNASQKFLLKNF